MGPIQSLSSSHWHKLAFPFKIKALSMLNGSLVGTLYSQTAFLLYWPVILWCNSIISVLCYTPPPRVFPPLPPPPHNKLQSISHQMHASYQVTGSTPAIPNVWSISVTEPPLCLSPPPPLYCSHLHVHVDMSLRCGSVTTNYLHAPL